MTRTITAEYLAGENKLKLDEPLEGVPDHGRIEVVVKLQRLPWLTLEGSLPLEAAEQWAAAIEDAARPDENES